MEPQHRKLHITIWYVVAAVAGVLLFQQFWTAYTMIEAIPYSQFEQLLKDGKIAEVGRMRDELLNESLFIDLDQARQLIGAWVTDYNTARPHSSLGYKTPAAYAGTLTAPKGVTLAEALTATG